ncbi:MAG: cyanophycin synthetase [Candidatus Humimicrobiaceae bacterium]
MLLAVALAELYAGKLDLDNLKECIPEVRVKGRFQVMGKGPLVVADASHNPEGISRFAANVYRYFKGKKKIIIFAVLKDKDYRTMVREIIKVADTLILTSSNNQRSLDIDSLESETLKIMKNSHIKIGQIYKIDNIENSLNFALNIADSNDIICIIGSITNLEHVV